MGPKLPCTAASLCLLGVIRNICLFIVQHYIYPWPPVVLLSLGMFRGLYHKSRSYVKHLKLKNVKKKTNPKPNHVPREAKKHHGGK